MAALALGLLGEARATRRYSRLQDFVRRGAMRAVIQITLANTGDEAYRPEVYGRSVTFQRTITEGGST